MENENVTVTNEGLGFMKYFKNIFIFVVITLCIVFACILFIKLGSNLFFWEMPKGNSNEQEPLKRNKRNIEEQIQDIKRNEKFTIDLEFLEQINSTDILENQITQLKKEVAMLKDKNNQQASSSSSSIISNTKTKEVSPYKQTSESLYAPIPTINVSENLEKQEEENNKYLSLSSIEQTLQNRLEKTLEKKINKQESVQSNATYVIKESDIDVHDYPLKEKPSSENKHSLEEETLLEDKSSLDERSTTSSDFEEFLEEYK